MAIDLSRNFNGLMEYPEKFEKKCIELYPDNEKIVDLLSKKSYLLCNELVIPEEVTDEEILEAANKNDFTEIAKKASDRIAKLQLRNDFDRLYDEQYLAKGEYIDEKYGNVVKSTTVKMRHDITSGKVKIKSYEIKGQPPHFSEEKIRRRN
jgi:hypothetical protein